MCLILSSRTCLGSFIGKEERTGSELSHSIFLICILFRVSYFFLSNSYTFYLVSLKFQSICQTFRNVLLLVSVYSAVLDHFQSLFQFCSILPSFLIEYNMQKKSFFISAISHFVNHTKQREFSLLSKARIDYCMQYHSSFVYYICSYDHYINFFLKNSQHITNYHSKLTLLIIYTRYPTFYTQKSRQSQSDVLLDFLFKTFSFF